MYFKKDGKGVSKVEFKKEVEKTGWWNGRGTVDSVVTKDMFQKFFDTASIGEADMRMILSIGKDSEEERGEECIPVSCLDDIYIEEIRHQLLDGQMEGVLGDEEDELRWSWHPDCVLEGYDVAFEDLSDTSKEYIIDRMLEGYQAGEICELVEEIDKTAILDIVNNAITKLNEVHDCMIDLVPEVLTSDDFGNFKALATQLGDLEEAYATEYRPLRFDEMKGGK